MKKNTTNNNKNIKLLTQVLFCAKIFRFLFFFYAFISFVFWFLNCFEVDWLYLFNWLFSIPLLIVVKFYRPEGISADFTLAIIGGTSLILGFLIDFIGNFTAQKIAVLEEEEERILMQKRKQKRKPIPGQNTQAGYPPFYPGYNQGYNTPNPNVTNQKLNEVPTGNSNLLFLIMPNLHKIKKNEDDLELTFQEVEIWKQRINKKLLENFNYSKPLQKGYYRKNLFLVYREFNYVDDFLYYLKPTLDSIGIELKKYRIAVSFCYVLSSISSIPNLEKELDCMDTILSLNFINEIIVTNRFKIAYDNKNTHNYSLSLKGEYNLSKNLTITDRQPLYSLKNKQQNQRRPQ